MNQLTTSNVQMTSLDIAEITGKMHKHVMADVRKEITDLGDEIGRTIFRPTERVDSQNRKQPIYEFGKEGAMQLALKYDAKTRFMVINRIDELEKGTNKPMSPLEIMQLAVGELTSHDKRITHLEDNMRMTGAQEQELNRKGRAKVVMSLGGKDSKAYKEISRKLFPKFWNEFNRYFEIPRYGELPKSRYDDALNFMQKWAPDTITRIEIESINGQQHMNLSGRNGDIDG